MRKELTGLIFLFLVILSSISLFTYHKADPCVGNGFFTIPQNIHNAFGLVGAHTAGIFVFLFGIGAFFVPIILGILAVWIFRGKSLKAVALSLLGSFLLMLTTGGLISFFTPEINAFDLSVASGGLISSSTVSFLTLYANKAGCIIVLIFLFLLGINLTIGTSFVGMLLFFVRKAGEILIDIKEGLQELIGLIGEKYKERARQKREEKRKIDMARITPEESHLPIFSERLSEEETESPNERGTEKEVQAEDEKNADREHESEYGNTAGRSEPEPEKTPYIKSDNKIPDTGNEKQDNEDSCHIKIVELPESEEFIPEPIPEDYREVDIKEKVSFRLPLISFLDEKKKVRKAIDTDLLKEKARILENKLSDFNISGEVVEILPGPVITTFEYRPAPGIKISRIAGLANDLALALSALSIRIVAPIPGRDVVGIEIPNDERETVHLRELITSVEFAESSSFLTLGLGKDILGRSVVTKMDSMPHLLIAGATGTGKSVGLNSMIIGLLYKATPDEVKMIMIDPKRIELSVYQDIPHLISPVVTDMKKATNALLWAVKEMERRYEILEQTGCRNIIQYNDRLKDLLSTAENDSENEPQFNAEIGYEKLPYIVIIVDELADLMMVASKDVEFALTRLAQMARAAGIHLIVATQRPSVDVLTGNIKANFPTRISFQVSSRVDARIIFDGGGSEALLGNGDMLFCPPGTGKLTRIQCAYISEREIARITQFLRAQKEPDYQEDITLGGGGNEDGNEIDGADYDEKYDEAVALVTQTRQASISFVQRRLRIGYNRAARLIEIMEKEGIVGPQIGSKPREILVRGYDDV
jgi:DNA segregation ATPase FtsK/SpoIIIE, S-DNA-T family